MAHATHFLSRLARVTPTEADLAMALYRDPLLVQVIIDEAEIPKDSGRCAIALQSAAGGPHMVVTRDGQFVTCLGAGMATSDLPIVSRARVDSVRARADRMRERLGTAQAALGEDFAQLGFFRKLYVGAHAVSREEISGALGLAPIMSPEYMNAFGNLLREIGLARVQARQAAKDRDLAHAPRRYWEKAWATGHFGLLTMADRPSILAFAGDSFETVVRGLATVAIFGTVGSAARLLWACGQAGAEAVPHLKAHLKEEGPHPAEEVALMAIALGHGKYEEEIRKALRANDSKVLHFMDIREEASKDALDYGQRRAVHQTRHLPQGHRWHFPTPESVPDALALAFAVNTTLPAQGELGLRLLLSLVSFLARAKAEDLYLPAELLEASGSEYAPWMAERLIEADPEVKPTPAVRGDLPGRNDPCHCGSGKKFKKCCA